MNDKSSKEPTKKHIFCNNCKNDTNHMCVAEHYRDYENNNPDGSIGFVERLGYRLWICAGCERGTMEEFYIFNLTQKEPSSIPEEHYFPERSRLHVKDKNFKQLPDKLTTIYRETLHAFNNKLVVLCAMGIRGLLEGICANKNITGRNLKKRIENLASILPQNIVNNLHGIRFIGNEAAHELSAPNINELRLAIEICEDLLNFLYELDYKASRLNSSLQSKKSATAKIIGVKP